MGQNKKVIYTCLVGDYDELRQPLVVDESFDYICFSNDIKDEKVGVWEIRPIPYSCSDKARLSRYVKLMPHRVLQDYEYSLWLDANIQIVGHEFFNIINQKIHEGGLIFQVNHCFPPCDCIYDEIKYAYLCGRSDSYNTFLQYRHLKKSCFPTHWGLFENNIILRKHNDLLVKKISEEWWDEFMKYTKRDQFSLMYVYWKNQYKPELLFSSDQNTRNVNFLTWMPHKIQQRIPNHHVYQVVFHLRKFSKYLHLRKLFINLLDYL